MWSPEYPLESKWSRPCPCPCPCYSWHEDKGRAGVILDDSDEEGTLAIRPVNLVLVEADGTATAVAPSCGEPHDAAEESPPESETGASIAEPESGAAAAGEASSQRVRLGVWAHSQAHVLARLKIL